MPLDFYMRCDNNVVKRLFAFGCFYSSLFLSPSSPIPPTISPFVYQLYFNVWLVILRSFSSQGTCTGRIIYLLMNENPNPNHFCMLTLNSPLSSSASYQPKEPMWKKNVFEYLAHAHIARVNFVAFSLHSSYRFHNDFFIQTFLLQFGSLENHPLLHIARHLAN